MQGGTPEQIYRKPTNDFVAGFIGKSNILYGTVIDHKEGLTIIKVGDKNYYSKTDQEFEKGLDVWVSLRPQYIRLEEDEGTVHENRLSGEIQYIEYLGGLVKGEILMSNNLTLEFEQPIRGNSSPTLRNGQKVSGYFLSEDVVIGRNIRKLN